MSINKARLIILSTIEKQKTKENLLKVLKDSLCFINRNCEENEKI